jgi:type II secretory pathway component PulF
MSDRFKYQAVSEAGEVREGVVTAANRHYVQELLTDQNLKPIRIDQVKKRSALTLFGFLRGSLYESLIMFTTSLATLHRAGIPLLRAMSLIRINSPGDRFNQAIDRMRIDIQSGRSLSEAMGEYDDLFSGVYIASVAAGEESGKLEDSLDELSDMLETEMELTQQVKTAVRYPLIVVGVIIAAFVVLMTYVVPKFVAFYAAFGAQLPLPTRIMISVSNFMAQYWIILLALVIVSVIGFRKFVSTDHGRMWYDQKLLRLPAIGEIIAKGNVARFALMFRILFKAGIPLVRTLEVLESAIKNTIISGEIKQLGELFQKGRDIADISKKFVFLPDLALNMMAVGMESGSLDDMTREIGRHYTREVMYRSRQLTSVLEPILTIVLGVFVLVMALAIFLPMWSLIRVFQG